MEVVDKKGKTITIGSIVRYTGTGTTGEVSAIKVENNVGWVKLDKNDLWYNSKYLEVIGKEEYKEKRKVKPEIKEQIKKLKKMREELEEVDVSSEVCDGGG